MTSWTPYPKWEPRVILYHPRFSEASIIVCNYIIYLFFVCLPTWAFLCLNCPLTHSVWHTVGVLAISAGKRAVRKEGELWVYVSGTERRTLGCDGEGVDSLSEAEEQGVSPPFRTTYMEGVRQEWSSSSLTLCPLPWGLCLCGASFLTLSPIPPSMFLPLLNALLAV